LNGTEIDSGSWSSGTPIVVDLSSLSVGIWNVTMIVSDVAGNSASDSVTVLVLPSGLVNPIPFEVVIIVSTVVVLLGVVVIVIIMKMKK
jgi:hypothetical protein